MYVESTQKEIRTTMNVLALEAGGSVKRMGDHVVKNEAATPPIFLSKRRKEDHSIENN